MGRESTKSRVSAFGENSDLALNGCMLAQSKLVLPLLVCLAYKAIWSIDIDIAHWRNQLSKDIHHGGCQSEMTVISLTV